MGEYHVAAYQDDNIVKRAYAKIRYTDDQIRELSACMDPVNGPFYFISNFVYVQHPVKGKEKLELYDYQVELLENYHKYRKSVNMLGRQLGKCCEKTTRIRVRNRTTGEIKELTMEEFAKLTGVE